jgi:outer membrane receptor protein involved in Fe transport
LLNLDVFPINAERVNIESNRAAHQARLGNLNAAQKTIIEPNCVPFNPFGANRTDQKAGVYDYIYGTSARTEKFKRTSASINLSGSPFSTWAGPVQVAVGYEYRLDDLVDTVPSSIAAISAASGFFATNFLPGSGKVTVNEGYGELGVPLLADGSSIGKLDLNAAMRYTHYSTSGGVTTWKVGAVYEPIPEIRFRGTLSRDIRAPNIPELFIPGVEGLASITRPDTLATGQVTTQAVSNPNLKPERADTFTAGIVLQPRGALAGLRLSVDYFNINLKNVIASLSALQVVARRFGPTQDVSLDPFIVYNNSALGIAKVGSPLLNLNSQKTNGVDFELQYRLPEFGIGQFNLGVAGTYTAQLETFDTAGASVGGNLAGESRGTPKWRVTTNLSHELGRFNTILTARYNSAFKYRNDLADPTDPGYDPTKTNSINDNHLPASLYLSVTENIHLSDRRDGPTVFFVVDNLFDKDPPFGSYLPLQAIGGFNPYDSIGRSYKVGFRFKF